MIRYLHNKHACLHDFMTTISLVQNTTALELALAVAALLRTTLLRLELGSGTKLSVCVVSGLPTKKKGSADIS